jgi:membrane protein insertase, YidC/Oxa1 family, C-terminal domain
MVFSAIFANLIYNPKRVMNKNSVIGFILIAAILFGWMMWTAPSKEELAQRQHVADSIRQVNRQRADSLLKTKQETSVEQTASALLDSSANQVMDSTAIAQELFRQRREKFGAFASASVGEDKTWLLENKLLKLTVKNKGGYIQSVELNDYKTFDSLPLVTFDPETSVFDLSFFAQNRTVNTSQFYFEPYLDGKPYQGDSRLVVPENDSLIFSMRLFADDVNGQKDPNQYLEFIYTIHPDNYMIGFDIKTVGMKNVIASNVNFLSINWDVDILKQEKSVDRFNGSTIYYRSLKEDDVDRLDEVKDDEELIHTKLKWVSFKQRFFCNVLIADDEFENAQLTTVTDKNPSNPRYLKSMEASLEVPYNVDAQDNLIPMSFYFGPNHFQTLKSYHLGLQRQIPLGNFFLMRWINYGVIYVFNWLGSYGWSYGIVILFLTLMIKVLLFPIAFKSYKSTAVMRALKPEVDAINEKYPKQEDAMKKQQAMMTLYKQAGASPAAGCVPMLLQMPILFAVFRFFPSSIELRQQPFLWANDLSTYDSILDLPFRIPGYGEHVSLFCLLMTITTVIYTYVNNKQMDATQGAQMKGMKVMMYLMPIMFLGIFNSYSAGLSYYYMLANIITFLQMYLFRLLIDPKKVRATIELNKKKPIKKSNFQKRLEEAQKAQLQQQRKRSENLK